MGNPITGIPTGIQMIKGVAADYTGLRANGYTPGTATFAATCHVVPVAQTAAAISDIHAGKSGNGVDFGRTLTTKDYAAKGTGITIDMVGSAAGIKGALDLAVPVEPVAPAGAARLPQDVAVNPNAPDPLPLNRPVGQSPTQNQMVQSDIATARADGATDFRVNQQQVDAAGNRVGRNRPDLQYTDANGQRVYIEYDKTSSTRGPGHEVRIKANDPNAHVALKTVD